MTISINGIKELVKLGLTIEAQQQIMELKESELGLKDENLKLKNQLSELREKLSIKENLIFENGVYYLDTNEGKLVPFCPICYDDIGKVVHLTSFRPGRLICQKCDSAFNM